MAFQPRFLFMPNYEDYQCHVGDVGLVINVLDMHPLEMGAMYVMTSGLVVQVACSLSPWSLDYLEEESDAEERAGEVVEASCGDVHLAGKVAAIGILAMRYLASSAVYISLGMLVASMLLMEQPSITVPLGQALSGRL